MAGEGRYLFMYQDTNGYWTIGIGHLIGSGIMDLESAKLTLVQELSGLGIDENPSYTVERNYDKKTIETYEFSDDAIDALFRSDFAGSIKLADDFVNSCAKKEGFVEENVTVGMRVAITSLGFNSRSFYTSASGLRNLLSTTLDWQTIDPIEFARQMSRWHHDEMKKECVPGLYNRRMDETCCFFTNKYPKSDGTDYPSQGWFVDEEPTWWRVCRSGNETNAWYGDSAYDSWYPRNVIDYISKHKAF